MTLRFATLASVSLLIASCGTMNSIGTERARTSGVGNAIVIEGEEFGSNRGTILRILQNNVSSLTVSRSDVCPRITLRGGAGRSQMSDALIYVDGQRFSDTCVLDSLDVEGVELVEVYPSGVTHRAGYHSNSGGLILVFMKNGSDAPLWEAESRAN